MQRNWQPLTPTSLARLGLRHRTEEAKIFQLLGTSYLGRFLCRLQSSQYSISITGFLCSPGSATRSLTRSMTIFAPTALVAALLCSGLAAGSSPNTIRGRRLQQVTQSQLAENNSPDSCWLQVDSTAYDVTSYANFHPGGSGAIHDQCGKDITSIYASSSQFHTPAALAAAANLGTVIPDPVATPELRSQRPQYPPLLHPLLKSQRQHQLPKRRASLP